ncbi:Methyltransferase domain protein [Kalmanozyma brasiliensis GHG001]|uniref:Methyltransferase domain-containing protein n=1 Tax=Kalmanozyma brasiliensis (strain GHG001) TaxID=1365824 RepID=V5EP90_KALBG|nr:Methyltransferase domain protein [Kalmanozyma brasiliensis GHG001]EST04748.1 Methyltransferase domain protein [Kalmanozyma brasiliensis GHG001]
MSSQAYHRSDDADVYRKNASFVYSDEYSAPVLKLLDPEPGDKILDLGCGSGELTCKLASAVGPRGLVFGQDASEDMIKKANASIDVDADGTPKFEVRDAQDPIAQGQRGQFDKVFSNAALHWMKRSPSSVVQNVYSSLRPGGSFAAEMGGFMNCVGVRSHLHLALSRRGVDPAPLDPWFFPTAAEYTKLLQEAGFTVETCELVPRLTPLPKESGLKGWLSTFAGPFLNAFDSQEEREEVVAEVEDALRSDAYDASTGTWSVMYVRLRFLAVKPK